MNSDLDSNDPLDDIEDEPELTPSNTRRILFEKAKLGFVRIEKSFVQLEALPPGTESRGSVLGQLVSAKKNRPLDLLLTVHALAPILEGDPLPLATWALLLSSDDEEPVTTRTVSSAFRVLEEMKLLTVQGPKQRPTVTLLKEDGSGKPRPKKQSASGRGFFTIPFEYWTDGIFTALALTAKAMLLIILKETQDPNAKNRTFTMPVSRAKAWYGISERSAERGYLELNKKQLIRQKVQRVADPQHIASRREVVHRVLTGPFTADYRENLRQTAWNKFNSEDEGKEVT